MTDENNGDPPWKQITGAIAIFLSALGGLAVTGLLQRAQLNHGTLLSIALGLVVLAAVVALGSHKDHTKRITASRVGYVAAIFFATGLFIGLLAVIFTQNDTEVPVISADLNPNTLMVEVTFNSSDIGSDDFLQARIDGVTKLRVQRTLYAATVGPNSDGDVEHKVKVKIPAGEFTSVGIMARLSNQEEKCKYIEAVSFAPTKQEGGCVLFLLPEAPK